MKNKLTNKEIKHAYENPEYLKEMFPEAFKEEPKSITITSAEIINNPNDSDLGKLVRNKL